MWLKLKPTTENVVEINTNIALAYLTMKKYNDQQETFDALSESSKRQKIKRLYMSLHKNRLLSEEVSKSFDSNFLEILEYTEWRVESNTANREILSKPVFNFLRAYHCSISFNDSAISEKLLSSAGSII